jgi:hypothetical protein
MTFQFAATSYSWVSQVTSDPASYGATIGSSSPMWSAKSDAVPDRSTKTQPCHSRTRTGFSPSVDLSKLSISLKWGAPIRLPSCR